MKDNNERRRESQRKSRATGMGQGKIRETVRQETVMRHRDGERN